MILSQTATVPSRVTIREASDVKAARTFLCEKQKKHSGDTQDWLEQWSKLKACNKHYNRLSDSKNWSLVTAIQCVWHIAERGECTMESKGGFSLGTA